MTKSIKIGRNGDNDIVIHNPNVSGYHCVAYSDDKEVWLEDMNSSNGTFINGNQITTQYISQTDKITLGKHYLFDVNLIFSKLKMGTYEQRQEIHESRSPQVVSRNQTETYSSKNKRETNFNDKNSRHDINIGGIGNELASAAHQIKSYVGKAILTWFLYYIGCFFTGLIFNILFLSEAGNTKRIINRSPPGRGCLIFLLIFHLAGPLLLIIFFGIFGINLVQVILEKLNNLNF